MRRTAKNHAVNWHQRESLLLLAAGDERLDLRRELASRGGIVATAIRRRDGRHHTSTRARADTTASSSTRSERSRIEQRPRSTATQSAGMPAAARGDGHALPLVDLAASASRFSSKWPPLLPGVNFGSRLGDSLSSDSICLVASIRRAAGRSAHYPLE